MASLRLNRRNSIICRHSCESFPPLSLNPGKSIWSSRGSCHWHITKASVPSANCWFACARRNPSYCARKILDAMTNNETWFFRDFYPFEALRQEIVPALMASRATTRSLRFWSAAASSGQEPYSIAMLLKEKFAFPNWKFSILATDICSAVRARAAEGRYSQMEINRGLPATMLTKYFVRSGLDWMIAPSVREMVEFQACNLAEPWPELPRMDVVFLRNVMIYFDVAIRKQILSRLRSVLQPDGVLFLGCAETTLNIDAGFERIPFQKTVYYRIAK